jgi:hypothetical protein
MIVIVIREIRCLLFSILDSLFFALITMNPIQNNIAPITPLKTPSQDAQGRWEELLSPRPVLTGQPHLCPDVKQTDQQCPKEKKKKKGHGNRKEQQERRKMRRRQQQTIDVDDTNQMDQDVSIIDDEHHASQQKQIEVGVSFVFVNISNYVFRPIL